MISVRPVAPKIRDSTAADAPELETTGWLPRGRVTIGLTAGASAPESLVQEVIAALGRLGPVEVSTLPGIVEDVSFKLPAALAEAEASATALQEVAAAAALMVKPGNTHQATDALAAVLQHGLVARQRRVEMRIAQHQPRLAAAEHPGRRPPRRDPADAGRFFLRRRFNSRARANNFGSSERVKSVSLRKCFMGSGRV